MRIPLRCMSATAVLMCTFVMLVGCPKPEPSTPAPYDAADSAPVDVTIPDAGPDGEPLAYPWCAAACQNLAANDCPEALTPDGGKDCYTVCAYAEGTGRFTLKPQCVAQARGVDAIRSCKTVRCKK